MEMISTPDAQYVSPGREDAYDGPFFFISRTKFRYMPTGSIYADITRTEAFSRIERIAQLGTVKTQWYNASANHSRGIHSEITALIADIVLYRNHFSKEQRKLGIAAGLLHDIAIPPYSDQGKALIAGPGKKFCEEDHAIHVIHKDALLRKALAKHRIDLDQLVATIQGEGPAGKLINSSGGVDADNLSYLMIDQVKTSYESNQDRKLILAEQGIFDQYNNVEWLNDQWVFTDPDSLVKLLEFRALMYSEIYGHPDNRAQHYFLKQKITGRKVPFETVLSWTDTDFEDWFTKTFGFKEFADYFFLGSNHFCEVAREYDKSKLEATRRTWEDPNTIVVSCASPRPAIQNNILHGGKVRPLESVKEYQEDIARTQRIVKNMEYIGVFRRLTESI